MMGRLKSDQGQLFYEFHLGDAVPEDHLVRKIDTALDLSWLRNELAPHYSSMGRPSIDPELMIRMLVVGYVFAIRSERLICREVQVNLAYRWFCKLGIEDAIPDHSAFSRARNERFREGEVFRHVFERVVEACIAAGLVGGEGFAVDASLIPADANKQRSIAGQDWHRDRDPARSSRAVKEYLATLDDTAWGAASDVVPKFVSPSDPAAQWTGAHKGPAFFAYSDNYLIDVKFGVIVDVEASRSIRQAEVGAARTMIERTEERFGLKPERLVGDTAYGAAPMLNWLVEEKGIAPHIPVFDKSKRDDGTFSRSDFQYDRTNDVYHCPGGKQLGTSGTVHEGKTLLYRASKLDCDTCPLNENEEHGVLTEHDADDRGCRRYRHGCTTRRKRPTPVETVAKLVASTNGWAPPGYDLHIMIARSIHPEDGGAREPDTVVGHERDRRQDTGVEFAQLVDLRRKGDAGKIASGARHRLHQRLGRRQGHCLKRRIGPGMRW
jgi:transposase